MEIALMVIVAVALAAALGLGAVAWRVIAADRRRSAARVAALAATAGEPGERVDPHSPVAVSSMFRTAPGAMLAGRPIVAATVMAALALTLAGAAVTARRDDGPAVLNRAAAPIELLSMRHTRDGAALVVTGIVRNPPAGTTVRGIAAIVSAFDRNGRPVAIGRAALDFTILEPGDESPFVVAVPDAADVGRYRVSFRTDAGLLRHVDRRTELMARRPD